MNDRTVLQRTEIDIDQHQSLVQTFTKAAQKVSAVVQEIPTMEHALSYVVELCDKKQACQLLISDCEDSPSQPTEELYRIKSKKIVTAPQLDVDQAEQLKRLCDLKSIDLVRTGLRDHLAGIDVGLTMAKAGIAETGTLVINSSNEDLRLATMICEIHVAILPKSRLYPSAFELEEELGQLLSTTPNYCSFITGASRTADIERVLALGVHGPLELHILLLEV